MTAFTGQWKAYEMHEPGRHGLSRVIPISGDGLVVAHVNCGHPDHKRNASMIAQAPAMIEALRELLDVPAKSVPRSKRTRAAEAHARAILASIDNP